MKIVQKGSSMTLVILRRTAAGGPTKDLPEPASGRVRALPGDPSLAALAQDDSRWWAAFGSVTFMVQGVPRHMKMAGRKATKLSRLLPARQRAIRESVSPRFRRNDARGSVRASGAAEAYND